MANTYYVSTTGSDSNNGLSLGAAFATLGHAASVWSALAAGSQGGVVINVAAGSYAENAQVLFTPAAASSGNGALTIQPLTAGTMPKLVCNPVSGAGVFFSSGGASGNTSSGYCPIVFTGFEVTDGTPTQTLLLGIEISTPSVTINGCYLHDIANNTPANTSGGAIDNGGLGDGINPFGLVVTNCTVLRCGSKLGGNQWHGIYLASFGAVAKGNLVVGTYSGNGIQGWHNFTNGIIANNTVVGNEENGIIIGSDTITSQNSVLNNNICAFNGANGGFNGIGWGIRTYTNANTNTLTDNCSFANLSGPVTLNGAADTITNLITSDPRLVNYQQNGTGNYRLAAGSPCIGAGTSVAAPASDITGVAWPAQYGYDIGCYAYSATTSTLQVLTYNSLNDSYNFLLDLNDFATFWIEHNSLRLPQPEKVYVRSFNPRTPGEAIYRVQYKNRHVQVSLRLKNSTTPAVLNSVHALLNAIENPPYSLRIAFAGSKNATYADVVAVKHNIPSDPQALLALAIPSIQIDFECAPGFRGDRQNLQNLVFNPGFEAPSGAAVQAFNDTFANVNAYAVQAGSAPTVASNVMTIPSGGRVAFGSPAWSAYNLWQLRFKWVTLLTATFYLHFTDANNYLAVVINGSTLVLQQTIASVTTTIQSQTATLTNTNFYWIQVSQFPQISGQLVYATVTLSNDSAGAIGTAVATSAGSTQNGVTAIVGQPQIAAAGAALAIGGAFTAVHRIFLFGPGGWVRADGGTGVTSMAWDGSVMQNGMSGNGGANTYPVGPVSSSGAFRVDFPPAGTPNMTVKSWVGGVSPVGTTAMPVSAISDVLYLSIWAKSFGLSATATIVLQLLEYNPSGVLQRTDTIATLTGNQPNWVALSGSVTTGTACAYAAINVVISDTGAGSANGTVWLDNCLCWDATVTSALTMPYQELRFPQSPGMLITSGLLGDMPATAIVQMGTYVASLATGHTMFAYLGRRAISTSSMRLVNPSTGGSCTIDNAAYGGYHLAANPGVFYGSTDNESGVYHFLARAQSSNAAPSNNVFIQTQVFMIEGGFSVTGAGNATLTPGSSLGPQMFPLTTQNVWTNCDLGQVQLPISPTGAISDPTQVSAYVSTGSGATTGGSGLTVNTVMLLPVDGELFQARIQNSANNSNAVTTQWVYLYWDGVTPTTTYSLEAAPLADAAHAIANPKGTVPIVFLNNVQLVVTSNADTVPQVDPTVDTSLQMGVNQYLLHVTDDAATVMPVACDIVYSPLYLYPR